MLQEDTFHLRLLKISRTLKHSKVYKAYQIVGSNENWNVSSQFINQAWQLEYQLAGTGRAH